MARSSYQQEKYDRGIALRAAGDTIQEVADKCGVSYNTARAWFNERYRERKLRYVREWKERKRK